MCDERRDFKAKNEHWQIIVQYLETYPELIRSKFDHHDGDYSQMKSIWQKLADHLNSLGYGQKSVEKWQLAIGRWKSKVKLKATNLRIEIERTGGGPVKSPPLTDLEERLMNIMGWKSIAGDKNKEFGIETTKPTSAEDVLNKPKTIFSKNMLPETSVASSLALPVPTLNYFEKVDPISPHSSKSFHMTKHMTMTVPFNASEATSQSSVRKKTEEIPSPKNTKKRRIAQSTEKSSKMVSLNQMHKENLSALKNIQSSLTSIATSIHDMQNDFREYLNFLKIKNS